MNLLDRTFIVSNSCLIYLLIITMSCLRVSAWNVRSLSCAGPYIHELLEVHSDILFISEHRLYEHELYKLGDIHPNFEVSAKSSYDLDSCKQSNKLGHCRTALFWHKELGHRVKPVKCLSDRLVAIEVVQSRVKCDALI